MSKIEVIDNKLQAIIEVAQGDSNNDIYVLSLDEKYDEPYLERLGINPLDAMPYLLNNNDVFFVRKVKI